MDSGKSCRFAEDQWRRDVQRHYGDVNILPQLRAPGFGTPQDE